MPFTIGRASILNGPTQQPFPNTLRRIGPDRIALAGTYYPEISPNDSADERSWRMQAFTQQFLGTLDVDDGLPLISTEQPHLSGVYVVETAEVDWRQTVSATSGVVDYRATLRKLRPSGTSPVIDVQYTASRRSTTYSTVNAKGVVFLPISTIQKSTPAVLTVPRAGATVKQSEPTLSGVKGFAIPTNTTVAQSFQYGTSIEDYYQSGCLIEARYGGEGSPWVPVEGSQIPIVPSEDLRISNGQIRLTFWRSEPFPADPPADYRPFPIILLERYNRQAVYAGPVDGWVVVGGLSIRPDNVARLQPLGTPMIVENRPGGVIVKYAGDVDSAAVGPSTVQSVYLSISLQRGQTFATLSGEFSEANVECFDPRVYPSWTSADRFETVTGGSRQKTAFILPDANSWRMVVASDTKTTQFGGAAMGATGYPNYGFGLPYGPRSIMLGAANDVVGTKVAHRLQTSDLIEQFWAAVSVTERIVSL